MKKKKQDNKENLFILGICMMSISVVFFTAVNKAIGVTFFAIGILYMIIGGRGMKGNKKGKNRNFLG